MHVVIASLSNVFLSGSPLCPCKNYICWYIYIYLIRILVGILNELLRAFVPAVLLGEAEPKANEQSAKPAENLAVISHACNIFFRT